VKRSEREGRGERGVKEVKGSRNEREGRGE